MLIAALLIKGNDDTPERIVKTALWIVNKLNHSNDSSNCRPLSKAHILLIDSYEDLIDDVKPFIVRDCNKARYISALNNARVTGNVNELVSYVKTEQESYEQAIKGMI